MRADLRRAGCFRIVRGPLTAPTENERRFRSFALLALLALAPLQQTNGGERLTAVEALGRLRATGRLNSATVTEPFDLAALGAARDGALPADGYRIENVVFEAPVLLVGASLSADVRITGSRFAETLSLRKCQVQALSIRDSDLEGPVTVEDCRFDGFSPFDGNRFHAAARFHLVELRRRPSFRDVSFLGPAEFLECSFGTAEPPARSASFSNSVFSGTALFNNSTFPTRARFQSVLFEQDAGFLNVRMPAGAAFRNCHFLGDAEFRFCRIDSADFGDRDNLTLFAKRADFRGCEFGSAVFDFAELRGEVSFAGARFGSGGASFRFANLGGGPADFGGVRLAGPLDLANAHIASLRADWREIREPVLAADPDARTLTALHARAEALGDDYGKLDIGYHLARQRFEEATSGPLPAPGQQPLGFIDAIGERLAAYGEWLLWGWPSGYGTKLGRTLMLAIAVWLLASIPPAVTPRLLARVNPAPVKGAGAPTPAIYDPLPEEGLTPPPSYPEGSAARLRTALRYLFRLLFKIGPNDIRCIASGIDPGRAAAWRRYFLGLWYLGSGLLLLVTLTLANTSPVINKLVGELFP